MNMTKLLNEILCLLKKKKIPEGFLVKYYFNFTLIANLKAEILIGCIRKIQGYLSK